jgi:hypothetical protein
MAVGSAGGPVGSRPDAARRQRESVPRNGRTAARCSWVASARQRYEPALARRLGAANNAPAVFAVTAWRTQRSSWPGSRQPTMAPRCASLIVRPRARGRQHRARLARRMLGVGEHAPEEPVVGRLHRPHRTPSRRHGPERYEQRNMVRRLTIKTLFAPSRGVPFTVARRVCARYVARLSS